MAGQTGSFKSALPPVSLEIVSERPETEVESVFDKQTLSRIELLAHQRGVSPQTLVSEIVAQHLAGHEIEVGDKIHYSKKHSTSKIQRGVSRTFVDPAELLADQIPVDEDFRDLI